MCCCCCCCTFAIFAPLCCAFAFAFFCLCARFVCVCIVNCFQSSSQLNDDADVDAANVAATVGDESMRLLLLPCMQEQSRAERESGLRERQRQAGRQASTRRVESSRVSPAPRLSPSPSPSPRLAHSFRLVSFRFVVLRLQFLLSWVAVVAVDVASLGRSPQ